MSLPAPDAQSTVLVTGASTGIGERIARQLAERGHHLAIVARTEDALEALASELRDRHGITVDVHAADLADPDERHRFVDAVRAAGRAVAGLVNNAGFGSYGHFWELDQDKERQEVQLNVNALHELTGAFLPAMVERGRGSLCNIGSVAGVQPIPGQATYGATKAFVNSFSEALHAELAGTGVTCTLVTPGPVSTYFWERGEMADVARSAPGVFFEDPETVAREAVEGMLRGKRVVVPGLAAKTMSAGGRFTPRSLLLPAAKLALERNR